MMYYFFSIVDSSFLSKSLALYYSLLTHMPGQFHFYVISLDKTVDEVLTGLDLKSVTCETLSQHISPRAQSMLDDPEVSNVILARALIPDLLQRVMQNHQLPHCTYLDPACYFFCSPAKLISGDSPYDLVLTPYRYSKRYLRREIKGTISSQFLNFKNNENAMHMLDWWKEAAWKKYEAEQRFSFSFHAALLSEMSEKFNRVYQIEHFGAGTAPWNIQKAHLDNVTTEITLNVKGKHYPIIFYNFHQVHKGTKIGQFDLGGYVLTAWVVDIVYQPYLRHLMYIETMLKKRFPQYHYISDWEHLDWQGQLREWFRHVFYGYFNRLELRPMYLNVPKDPFL